MRHGNFNHHEYWRPEHAVPAFNRQATQAFQRQAFDLLFSICLRNVGSPYPRVPESLTFHSIYGPQNASHRFQRELRPGPAWQRSPNQGWNRRNQGWDRPDHGFERPNQSWERPRYDRPFSETPNRRYDGTFRRHFRTNEGARGDYRTQRLERGDYRTERLQYRDQEEVPIVGKPTITARKIDEVLARANSPARGLGEYFMKEGRRTGINPAYALAFFCQESSYGRAGVAKFNNSIGNIRGNGYYNFKYFPNWESGITAWFDLIKDRYLASGPRSFNARSLPEIIRRYAPSQDGNNERAYVANVRRLVKQWAFETESMTP